ncbi:hypothetical protein D3C72_918080 [compost metagenome]
MFKSKLSRIALSTLGLIAISAPAAFADGYGGGQGPAPSPYGNCYTDTVDTYAALVPAIYVKGVKNMNWGAIALCTNRTADVYLYMDQTGKVTGGNADVKPIDCLDRSAAEFELRGAKGCEFKYEVNATDLYNGNYQLKLELDPQPEYGAGKFPGSYNDITELSDKVTVKVGGKLRVGKTDMPGKYKGTMTLVAAYK